MIRKITSNEYLKRYDNMDAEEFQEYAKRVDSWLNDAGSQLLSWASDSSAQLSNVEQLSLRWNDVECERFHDGVRLLSAMSGTADTWLPDMIYLKSARRAIRRMLEILSFVQAPDSQQESDTDKPVEAEGVAESTVAEHDDPAESSGKVPVDAAIENPDAESVEKSDATPAGSPLAEEPATDVTPLPSGNKPAVIRPKHIDQYVHLLPEGTQQKAVSVKGLLRDLDTARENARLLMDAGEAAPKIEQWAKTAVRIDNQLRAIYKEIDAEWDKLVKSGRVGVDDFGNAYIKADPSVSEKEEEDAATAETSRKLTKEDKAKIKALRTFLRDTRYGDGDKRDAYVEKWLAKYREMVALGGTDTITEAVINAARHYGIDLSKVEI